MSNPIISIIIPVYNSGRYLRKCLDSICCQLFKDYELILVDDGSTDDSGEICDYYGSKDERITVIHKINEGVSVARNTGILKSRAPWLCFMDSDDWVDDKYISSFVNAIDSKTEFVSQNVIREFSDERMKPYSLFNYDDVTIDLNDDRLALYRVLHNGVPYAKLFKKDLLIQNSLFFDKRISFHEDHIFVLRYLSFVNRITLLANASYHYMYWNTGSLSSRFNEPEELILSSDELLNVIEDLKPLLSSNINYYINQFANSYGIYQLICACKNVKKSNYRKIFSECDKRFNANSNYIVRSKWIYNYIIKSVNYSHLYFFLFLQLRSIRFIKTHK